MTTLYEVEIVDVEQIFGCVKYKYGKEIKWLTLDTSKDMISMQKGANLLCYVSNADCDAIVHLSCP